MKFTFSNIILFFFSNILCAQIQSNVSWSVEPNPFNENEKISVKIKGLDPSKWSTNDIYLWTWFFDSSDNEVNSNVNWNGQWNNSKESMKMTKNNDGSFSYEFIPNELFQYDGIGKIGVLAKARDGTGDKKTPDHFFEVGKFDITINSPITNPFILPKDKTVNISVTSSIELNYTLKKNENDILSELTNTKNFIFKIKGSKSNETAYEINESTSFNLFCEDPNDKSNFKLLKFEIILEPEISSKSPPLDLNDGLNYINDDTSIIYLQLNAPQKDFVYVLGNFNDFSRSKTFLMHKNPETGKFWIMLENLVPTEDYIYQYEVFSKNPVENSPNIVRIADPFSNTIVSEFDDSQIPQKTYPDIINIPTGQRGEYTYFNTTNNPYQWKVKNFKKPKKDDLIIYEILIRDFDKDRNFQDLIDRIEYFKDLNINAIQLMPVMEFEGNESWGYNTSYHMSLDKFYGTKNKLKEFIDLCHDNGIAIILDLAINHSFGRNPLVRMWMNDPDNNGWGEPSSENPYFNSLPMHTYSVGYDFNHQSSFTQDYTKGVLKYWIKEFNIDGIRWDLTKGFTQNCSQNDYKCTDSYQQDRVDVLKMYADYSWFLDPDHYVIFEHLGSNEEEKEWANYRIDEGKGVMLWGKMTSQFNQLTMGFKENSSISRLDHKSRGFLNKRLITYAESHDEERLMFKNINYGNSSNSNHDVKNLKTSLLRMKALGSIFLLTPGPKMIWHFSEMGFENSIYTCENGNFGGEDCKLDTKPQPQWDSNWPELNIRKEVFDNWKKIIDLKINEPVFEGDFNLTVHNNDLLIPEIQIWNKEIKNDSLKYVYVVSNFNVVSKTIKPNLPIDGKWKNLLTDQFIDYNSNYEINLDAGSSIILGNYKNCGLLDSDSDGIGDVCDDDDDNDGVLDVDDVCPNTPSGTIVDVTGCAIFTLPANNNKVEVTSATCIGNSDGSIGLSVEDNSYDYSITVTGKDDPIVITGENKTASITGLAKGDYTVCFKVTGQDAYEQCFEVTIGEPKALSAFIDVDNDKRTTSIQLSGSKTYNIDINGQRHHVKGDNFTTSLPTGLSIIKIYTDLECQGMIEREIFISEDILYYPNPTQGEVDVFVNGEDKGVTMSVFTTKGDLVFTRDQGIQESRKTQLDLSGVPAGTYLITLDGPTVRKTFKIVKR